jgi:glutamyl-tRNA reductase
LKKLSERTVLVVSAGDTGKLAAKSLLDSGVSHILVTNRTHSKARELAAELGGEAVPFSDLTSAVATADIVISATGAEGFVLRLEDIQEVMNARDGRSLLLIDIAVPRDIDPRVRELRDVHLYDIDDLQQVADTNLGQRAKETGRVEAIIEEEIQRFEAWWHSQEVVPTIAALQQHAEASRRTEVDRTLKRLSHLSAEDQRRIDAMTSAIVKKILHRPITHLKTNSNGHRYTEALRELFDLENV